MRTSHGIAAALTAGFQLAAARPCGGGNNNNNSTAESAHLWVTTYPAVWGQSGKVITLQLAHSRLTSVAESEACGVNPSWLTQAGDVLYCVNEAWGAPQGDLYALAIGSNAAVTRLGGAKTRPGPVSNTVYGNNGRGLAVANYAGAGIDTFNVEDPSAITLIKTEGYAPPGDNQSPPQDVSRPHQAVLDPTGDFLVFPDLGADVLRVFKVNKETLEHEIKEGFVYPPEERGTGPRHVAFYKAGDKTFLYVVAELKNLIQGFSVEYTGDDLKLTRVFNATTHGDDQALPSGTAAAEIYVSPDGKFITLSSRNERSLEFTLADGTTVPSDPLITFKVDHESGALELVQVAPAGGINPRHFSFNKDGTLVASAAQSDSRIVVFRRNVATGEIGEAIAEAIVEGNPNSVIFQQ
ncbi:hypothetical protein VTJ83DRAFT_4966 [Remersonia thermophila]|uniref:6-phosphogluconolactonase n=1 Tax=Remersonia thermophila TaxID=72144 RepID=A0ABR4DDI4_9PEZI